MQSKIITDLAKAAFLVARGYPLTAVRKLEGAGKVAFEFEASEHIDRELMNFLNRKAQVDALTFSESLRGLKALIHR